MVVRGLVALIAALVTGACALPPPPPGTPGMRAPGMPGMRVPGMPQRSILFVGNSFTQGSNSAALRYRPELVEDLNGEGVGGVPAIFARLVGQAGLDWRVAHETRGGATLAFHLAEKRDSIARPWDVAVLQQFSVLDPDNPGDPATTAHDAPALARLVDGANDAARVYLMATWSRADQVYRPEGHWHGQPVAAMAEDVARALEAIDAASPEIDGVIPVGAGWNRAMATGLADPNPYDGRAFGQVDLWSWDQYHASAEGSYLAALIVFAQVTGHDPRAFGAGEKAAHELGIAPGVAARLQEVAAGAPGPGERD